MAVQEPYYDILMLSLLPIFILNLYLPAAVFDSEEEEDEEEDEEEGEVIHYSCYEVWKQLSSSCCSSSKSLPPLQVNVFEGRRKNS